MKINYDKKATTKNMVESKKIVKKKNKKVLTDFQK
jgi:hypothetical protein